MLSLPPAVRIFVATAPTNMHLAFDRLAALAREILAQDPLSGHLVAFFNRSADRVTSLYWDRSGFCLRYKRLERGACHLPHAGAAALELAAAELRLLLDGIELAAATRRTRFTPPAVLRAGANGSRGRPRDRHPSERRMPL